MKRTLACLALLSVTTFALAQSSFTIVRPFDGSKVREKVRILMPKNSIPPAGYIGVFLEGKFIEAVEPKLDAKKQYFEYVLDTKARQIADGTKKLELKLYVDYSTQPRIVDTSSVEITVANSAGITIPEEGLKLRYSFQPGTESLYRLKEREVASIVDEAQNKEGVRAAQFDFEGESMNLLYAVDNAYDNGEGLVRIQVVPDKGTMGREYAFITTARSTEPMRFYSDAMSPVYMRVTNTGREVFGSIPDYFGIEGTTGQKQRTLLIAAYPMPVLPSKAIRVGDSWQAQSLVGAVNLDDLPNTKTVTVARQARGEFVGVEWEMGHPCAKIRNVIEAGTGDDSKKKAKPGEKDNKFADLKISREEIIWFALDLKKIIRINRDETTESKVDFGTIGGNTGGPPAGGGAQSGPPRGGGPGGRRGGGSSPDDFINRPGVPGKDLDLKQRGGPRGGPPAGGGQGRPGGPMGPGGPGGPQGPGGFGPGGPGAQQSQVAFIRQRRQVIITLIK